MDPRRIDHLLKRPRVDMTLRAFRKLQLYIERCPMEIGGLGRVEIPNPEELRVVDVFTLDQVVTRASTTLDPDAVADLVTTAVRSGDDPSTYRCWWHSHGDMPAYFSQTDRETIARFSGDFLVSIVGSRRGEFACRLDILRPFEVSLVVPLVCSEEDALRIEVMDDIGQQVTPAGLPGRIAPAWSHAR